MARLENGDVLFAWPLAAHLLTVGNYYRGADGSYKSWHGALDFRAAVGTPVYAAEGGTVAMATHWNGRVTQGDTNSYGNCIKLRHANYAGRTLETLYAHLDKICVTAGQAVKEGALIGYSGSTGNSSAAHLHFEVRFGGLRKNPLCWLDSDFAPADGFAPYTYGAGECAVARPACGGLQMLAIGPASAGDAMQLWALAQQLGIKYSSKKV